MEYREMKTMVPVTENPAGEVKKGRLMLVATALLWGLAGVCVKEITWNSLSIMAARSFTALVFTAAARRNLRLRLTKNNIIAAVSGSATGILYMMGIKLTNAATAIVLQYTSPIIVLLIGIFFYHRRVRAKEVLAVLIVFAGCVLSFAGNMSEGNLLGNILSLASGFTQAIQIITITKEETDAEDSLILSYLISMAICVPFLFFDAAVPETGSSTVLWLFILCVFQFTLANFLFSRACHRVGDLECSLILTIEPIFNPIPVAIVCKQWMNTTALVGFVMVISGIVFYTVYHKSSTKAAE